MVKSVKSCKIYHASTSSRVIVTLHKNFPFSHSKVCPWLASKNPPPTDLRPLWNSWRPVMQVVVQMAAVKTAIHYITEWNMHDSHTTSHMQSIQKCMPVAMICLTISSFCFLNIVSIKYRYTSYFHLVPPQSTCNVAPTNVLQLQHAVPKPCTRKQAEISPCFRVCLRSFGWRCSHQICYENKR